ncbi:DUF6311 domain-containing protein [Synechocystis sp. LKSZ1]|uniref:DUF6311 domain-containing protein n=1 Tax=Synechocystis sp. LKSZ1 TaxID=3144951 RepID=UPI00336BB276
MFAIYLLRGNLNLYNIDWLFSKGDPASHFIGWLYYSQDSWRWPITFTQNLSYPTGNTIAYSDSVPLLAIFFKVLAHFPIFSPPIQYFGILITLNLILQFFLGAELILLFKVRSWAIILLSGLLFMLSPILVWRLQGHFALSSHWPILAALWSFFKLRLVGKIQTFSVVRPVYLLQILLLILVAGIHPYIAVMVLAIVLGSYLQGWLDHNINLGLAIFGALTMLSIMLGAWYFWGYFYIPGGGTSGGYDVHSMNLLSPLTKNADRSFYFLAARPSQWEGYGYLGLGLIALFLANLLRACLGLFKGASFYPPLVTFLKRHGVLLVICLGFTVYAISNRVTWGHSILFEYPLLPGIREFASRFRASGRFFWPTYYVLMFSLIIASLKLWHQRQVVVLLLVTVLIQWLDLGPVYSFSTQWMYPGYHQNTHAFISKDWQALKQNHQNLFIVPSYQCGNPPVSFPVLESIAALLQLKTNSAYLARYSDQSLKWHCETLPQAVAQGKLEKNTAYVLDKSLFAIANQINQTPGHSHRCTLLDGLILCQQYPHGSETLRQKFWINDPILFTTKAPNSAQYLLEHWSAPEEWGTWTEGKTARLQLPLHSIQPVLKSIKPTSHNTQDFYLEVVADPFVNENHFRLVVDVLANQQPIAKWQYFFMDRRNSVQRLRIPRKLVASGQPLTLTFQIHEPASPARLGMGDDQRLLGLQVKGIQAYGTEALPVSSD